MKILVVEDNLGHQESARETLKEHDLTIVSSFHEAMAALNAKGMPYEAVLTDMMLPGVPDPNDQQRFFPEESPCGMIVALQAAHRGAKFVAMLTDANHHKVAISSALDLLSGSSYDSDPDLGIFAPVLAINGAHCIFAQSPMIQSAAGRWGKNWGRVLNDLIFNANKKGE